MLTLVVEEDDQLAGPASPKQIRQMVRAAIVAALAGSGWRESRHPYDLLTLSALPDGRQIEHLGYAIGIVRTVFSRDMRQRAQSSTLATTTVGVRWGHRLRADSPPTDGDYDAALDQQVELVKAIRAVVESQGQQLRVSSVATTVAPDGVIVFGELDLEVVHHYQTA